MKSIKHLSIIKEQDNYDTPPKLFNKACKIYKIRPVLDVCASSSSNLCYDFFTEVNDSLLPYFKWDVDFFMNPPYSKVEKFMKKAWYEYKKYNVDALILIFAKTDTKWWHSFVEGKAEVHFIKGRIKFYKNGFETKNSAPYPSCWIIYRKK